MSEERPTKTESGRYAPSESEKEVLKNFIHEYFSHQKRSSMRTEVSRKAHAALVEAKYHNWNERKVRIWFRNNRSSYLPDDPSPDDVSPIISPFAAAPRAFQSVGRSVPHHVVQSELPPLPEVPADGASVQEIKTRINDIARYAKLIPRDPGPKQQHVVFFKDAEVTFRECLKKLPPEELPLVVDGGATVIEMPDSSQSVDGFPIV
jgi:hypothetical protein